MKCYGLIGFPLSHSFSENYFTEKFIREGITDCTYDNFPLAHIGLLNRLITEKDNLCGLNVTIPYKEQVIPFLHSVEEEITHIGAVNTIKVIRNGSNFHLKGFNTDVHGFSASLRPFLKGHFKNALILGTGGASKAVAYVLKKMGIVVTYVSRAPKQPGHISYEQLTRQIISSSQVIVNASPVGMYPNIGSCPPIPYQYLTPDHVLFDLIYNPPETIFLAQGRKMGVAVINGTQMLHLQADKAWEIWNSNEF